MNAACNGMNIKPGFSGSKVCHGQAAFSKGFPKKGTPWSRLNLLVEAIAAKPHNWEQLLYLLYIQ